MSHETIRIRLEKHIPCLEHMVSLHLLTDEEVCDIIEERTSFEYKICCSAPLYRDFSDFITYEKKLFIKLRQKAALLGVSIPYKWTKVIDGWIHKLYERLIVKVGKNNFTRRESCIIEYVDYLAERSNISLMNTVLARALECDPTNDTIWMLLLRKNAKQIKDIHKWRALLSRATRMCQQKEEIYHIWISTEVAHIEKLISVIINSEDQKVLTEVVERLLPLEEVPACIFSSYISNISRSRLHKDGIDMLQSFLEKCKAPWGRRIMEYMGAHFVARCKATDQATEQHTPLPIDIDSKCLDDDKYKLQAKNLIDSLIEEWEITEERKMYTLKDFIVFHQLSDKQTGEFDVVTDEEGHIVLEENTKPNTLFETMVRTFHMKSHFSSKNEFTRRVLTEFEDFAVSISRRENGKKPVLPDSHLDELLCFMTTKETGCEKEKCNLSDSEDINTEILSSFLSFFINENSNFLANLIRLLRFHTGLLKSPASLSVLATYVQSGTIGIEAVFQVGHKMTELHSPLIRFVSCAWEEVTSDEFKECYPVDSCFTRFHMARWIVLKPLMDFFSYGDDDSNSSVHSSSPIENLCQQALQSSIHDLAYAKSQRVDLIDITQMQMNECTVFCISLLHQVGKSSRFITDKFCSFTHIFGSATWKILARHYTVQDEAHHFRQWVYTSWLKSASGDGEALVEAYAACISSKHVFASPEVERLVDEAHKILEVQNFERIFLPLSEN